MSPLSELLAALVAHGPMLLLGTTVVLAGGCLLMLLHRGLSSPGVLGVHVWPQPGDRFDLPKWEGRRTPEHFGAA